MSEALNSTELVFPALPADGALISLPDLRFLPHHPEVSQTVASSSAAASAPRGSPVSLLAPVELQLIFAHITIIELRHCWTVSRRWHRAASGLTHNFLKHQGHDGRLRIGRSAMLLLLQSPMRLLVNDLAVLRRALLIHAHDFHASPLPPSDDSDSDESAQHCMREFDQRDGFVKSDPSALTCMQLVSIVERMPQLQHLTAKLAKEQRDDEDSDLEEYNTSDEEYIDEDGETDEDDARAHKRQRAKARQDAVKEEAASLILTRDAAAGASYRFPRGLMSLRLSLISDGRTDGVGLQLRRVIHSASLLASLELLSISLREGPRPHRPRSPCFIAPLVPPELPGCLTPLLRGAARQSLRVLRFYHIADTVKAVWTRWNVAHLRTAFDLPRLQKLRMALDRAPGLLQSALAQGPAPTQLQEMEWCLELNFPRSQAMSGLSGLRTLRCKLLADADLSSLALLMQLKNLRAECSKVDPAPLSYALSQCTRMRVLDLQHCGMRSEQLSMILTGMPQLHSLTLCYMNAVEDFSFFSRIPALATSLRTLRLRMGLTVQEHMAHISALIALTELTIWSDAWVLPADAWTRLQQQWALTKPCLRIVIERG